MRLPQAFVEGRRLDVAAEAQESHSFGEARRALRWRVAPDLAEGLEGRGMLARLELDTGEIQTRFVVTRELGEGPPQELGAGRGLRRGEGLRVGLPRLEGHGGTQGDQHLAGARRRSGGGEGDVAGDARQEALQRLDRARATRGAARAPRGTSSSRILSTTPPSRSTVPVTSRQAPTASATRMEVARLRRTAGSPRRSCTRSRS